MDVEHHMDHNLKLKRKQVLSDPVAVFSLQYPEADASKKNLINELRVQLQLLKEQGKEIQTKTKILSRQIGAAKKSNQPATELIHSMQIQSSQYKQLGEKISHVEEQILNFFVINDETLPKTKAHKTTLNKRYAASIDHIDKVTVHLLDKEENAWNDYVSKQPVATIHHLTQWRDVFQKTYGIESFYFFARDSNNQIVGVLPLVRLKSRLFGDLLVSMPYFQRGGVIADHPLIEQELMKAANEKAARLGVEYIEYRDDIPREGLPVQSHKVNMVLSLPDSEEVLWKGFTAKLRAQIKRPQQLIPKVLIGGKEYLDDFYKVYTRNMRDLGSPAHSKLLVENILDCFSENSWIIVIHLNNKPVSAGLLLGHGDTMEIPLASTIRKANPYSMNMMLYWEILKLAIQHGYKNFDFGRSSKGAGTYGFKRQWGAQPKQLYWHYWLEEGVEPPKLNPDNPKYALVINIWKRLPIFITKWIGPFIVKHLP